MFKGVPATVDFPNLEQRIITFWQERSIFRKSLEKDSPNGHYIFYEGPPTANGKPGVHHVISRAFKDLFPRYKTMQGFRVSRKGGWDTHGLPVEIAIEKQLGFTSKAQVEAFGIEKFNRLCRKSVFEYIQDWNRMTERIGFWLDLEDAYITYDNRYIESCWWVLKELWIRGLLVEDYKTTWHSPSSNTTLASHEVSLGYREDVEDPSVFPKFPARVADLADRGLLKSHEGRKCSLLAWTTTPWTLAANTGLAVRPDARYALVEGPGMRGGAEAEELYILAEDLLQAVLGQEHPCPLITFPGSALEGVEYQPILMGRVPASGGVESGWRVVLDEFVSLEDGTGIVHLAPAYGDLDLGRKHGLPTAFSVDLTGKALPEVRPLDALEGAGPYTGAWFKDADALITQDLVDRGLMFAETTVRHAYPFNWRDGTPLMNVAKRSWYIRTTHSKKQLLANNDAIHWYPDNVRTGRFGRWLENNVDWALSRERFWGAPLPIWESEDGEQICLGSVAELQALAGRDLSDLDLHRPYVDEITFERGGKIYRRVPYTVDVWFESGAMPYAQQHYLGKKSGPRERTALAENFPADYICEAVDQTRGWFYSLHALATLLTDGGDKAEGREPGPLAELATNTSAFKNVIVLGHIVDEQGEKMSKSKGNVVDPWPVLDQQGADALRWYLYSTSPPEATKRFSANLVDEVLRDFFMTLWNSYSFFVLYANLDKPDLASPISVSERPTIDRWLLSRLNGLTEQVTDQLDVYDPTGASRNIRNFVVDELSNWYVRRNRRRFWKSANDADKLAAYTTLHEALCTVALLMAPMAPFVSEEIYQNLVRTVDPTAPESVHLASWPAVDKGLIDGDLDRAMAAVIRLVELGRSARARSGFKVRQPLPEALIRVQSDEELSGVKQLEAQVLEELNVKRLTFLDPTADFVEYTVRPNLRRIGRQLGRMIPALKAALQEVDGKVIAANIREAKPTVIELEGEPYSFTAEDFLLEAKSPDGFAAVEDRGYLTALNTELTPDLVREGQLRDLIRLIQNVRKSAGFEVSDRIDLGLVIPVELRPTVAEGRETLLSEVLAEDLSFGELGQGHSERVVSDGTEITISVRKR